MRSSPPPGRWTAPLCRTGNPLAALRVGYAALILATPDPVTGLYTRHRADPLTRAVTRLLGYRHLIQGILTGGTPSPLVLALGVQVDLAHAVSMLGLAVLDQRRRRAGLIDAAVAGSFALAGAVLATRAAPEPPALSLVARLSILRQSLATRIARRTLLRPIYERLSH
ncbi:MAG TPA: hypothetical protein VFO16_10475 [Pseudonocardiaceae bacterium]|nr:hypothetical protein [Pseudonocardiaceae bacterium]